MASDTGNAEDRVAKRYPRPSKRLLWIAVPLAVALVAWTIWAGTRKAEVGISAEVHGFQVAGADRIDVLIDVYRPDPSRVGSCTVRAQAASGQVVGEATVAVPAGETNQVRLGTTIRTVAEPTTATIASCQLV